MNEHLKHRIPYWNMLEYYVKCAREKGIPDEEIKKVVYLTKEDCDYLLQQHVPHFHTRYINILKRYHTEMMERLKKNNDYGKED